ncbi:hypothetical protein FKR81_28425 [Lentzea tibetensis]|uniref:Putative zinc-finger domain-containing protein n=1 Tax=Lentzea tibetensis TaxID=2591470 RepID=A0A563EMY7_9PSEU|nr:zf-HC2 domain-containing protein [Lentzea tibetensis]TWP48512.1 hypothetical protein FKR81_28425 [Lentzea tibetensis]
MSDNLYVDCDTCREALSARLDGEPESAPADQVEGHLAECADCRAWQDQAAALTRTLRLRPATPVPDLTAAILDAAPVIEPPRPRGWLPRMLLGGVAVAQLTIGLAQILGTGESAHSGHSTGVDSSHLFNESTAWNLALGLGLLWTALRPAAASGLLPVVGAFVAVLIPFSASDLLGGAATVSRVTTHALLILGLALLVIVHRGNRDPHGRTPVSTSDSPGAETGAADAPEPGTRTRSQRRVRLRPVSRRRAA